MPDNIMTTEAPAPTYRNRSPEIDKLAAALAKAQGLMENAEKSAENPAFKRDGKASTYATLASVWTAIRSPLATNGLAVMQWPRTVEGGVEIETELLHETGQFVRDILWLPCPQMTVHSVGSTITYGRRYALMAIVGIAPEDDDGNAAAGVGEHKPGAPGMAGGGTDFRPAGPRRFQGNGNGKSSWGPGGKQSAVAEAQRDGLIPPPKPAANAIEQMEWIKASRKIITDATTKGELSDWWRQNDEARETAAAAVPVEFDKLIVLFDDKMTTLAQAGA